MHSRPPAPSTVTTWSYTGDVIVVPRKCTLVSPFMPNSRTFSFPLLSDIFQSGFRRNSDDIKGHSVHSNHIQGYEHYVAFPASPFHDALHIINESRLHDVVDIA